MKEPISGGGSVTQRWGYTGLVSNGPYYDNRYSPARFYPSGFHTGVDLSAPSGSIVRNMEHGVVVAASWNGCQPNGSCWGYGGGYVVIVKHNSVPVYSSHAHMRRVFVSPGQPVYRGRALGELDTMGYATGPHDHVALWIRGLWWSSNRGYTLDPWSAMHGALRSASLLDPASCRVPLNVNLRAGPGRGYPIVATRRARTVLPMFKTRQGGSVPGYASHTWRLVWAGRWAWVFAPLTTVVRSATPDDADLAALGAVPFDEVGGHDQSWHADKSLSRHSPSPVLWADQAPPDEPDGVPFRSKSSVAQFADADDAF